MKNNEDSLSPYCETPESLKRSEKSRDIRKVEKIRKEINQSRGKAIKEAHFEVLLFTKFKKFEI